MTTEYRGSAVLERDAHEVEFSGDVPNNESQITRSLCERREAFWRTDLLSRLYDLIALPDDWDREGSSAIAREVAARTKVVINVLADAGAPRPFLAPTQDGSLALSWQGADVAVELEVLPDGAFALYYRLPGEEWEGGLEDSPQPFAMLLSAVRRAPVGRA